MAEEAIMRKRLAVEGDGGGDDRRVMSLLKTFVRWCGNSQLGEEEGEATYQKMLFTLGQCGFSFKKTQMVMEMNKREMERYCHLSREIEAKIEESKQQITSYREELLRARVIRKHRQEYDAMAKVIQKHPPRQQSQDKITELEARLQKLQDTHTALEQKLDLRRKQFHLLAHSIHLLQDTLQEEEEGEGGCISPVSMDTS